MRTRIGVMTMVISVAAMSALPAIATAEERSCRGTIGKTQLDNIVVPQGAKCVLKGTRAKGTVKVERGASLRAFNVRVVGNVQGENALRVAVLRGSRVGGSVQVEQGGFAKVKRSRINGDIQLESNRRFQRVVKNRVGGSIQIMQNRRGFRAFGNVVIGNLQCKQNGRPISGGKNRVHGSKEDQCSRL